MGCKFMQCKIEKKFGVIKIDSWCTLDMVLDQGYYILKACNHNLEPCLNFTERETPRRYISKSDRYLVLERQHWCCNMCGIHLKYSKNHSYGDIVAHIDHIHPFSQWETYNGDINELKNLEALCPDCNLKKHAKGGF